MGAESAQRMEPEQEEPEQEELEQEELERAIQEFMGETYDTATTRQIGEATGLSNKEVRAFLEKHEKYLYLCGQGRDALWFFDGQLDP